MGGSAKVEGEAELSPNGMEDFTATATAEASAGAFGQQVKIGVQDKVSLISGRGSVKGTGIMKGTTISEW